MHNTSLKDALRELRKPFLARTGSEVALQFEQHYVTLQRYFSTVGSHSEFRVNGVLMSEKDA